MKIYKRCEENWKPIPGINYQNLFYPLSFCYNKMKMLNNEEPFELLVVRPVTEMNTNGFAISLQL